MSSTSESSPVVVLPPSTPTRYRSANLNGRESSRLHAHGASPAPSVDSGVEDVFGSPQSDKDSAEIHGEARRSDESRKLLDNNPFDNEKTRVLFKAVDKLRDWQAHEHVAIPQLVIVGGQSSGKSSLLKGLTEIPFPVSGKCCTRFPTRIVTNRSAPGTSKSYRITIEKPDVQVSGLAQLTEDESEFTREGVDLTEEIFSTVMDEASQNLMQISHGQGNDKRNFVSNVLKVELFGPDLNPLSILDLPGIISAANTVKEEEKEGVREMVIEYMKQPQNIIICVISANTDLDHQEILKLALQHADPRRLVGVLTKCDKVEEPEMKRHWADFALNRSEDGGLTIQDNWFVVRNRHGLDDDSFDVATAENRIFAATPWSSIPTNRRGISVLRTHIAGILADKLRLHFPRIRAEMAELLESKQGEKLMLGEPRTNYASSQKFLVDHVSKMEESVKLALHQPGLLSQPDMRLRQHVKDLSTYFDASVRSFGHKWDFEGHQLLSQQQNQSASFASSNIRRLPSGVQARAEFKAALKQTLSSNDLRDEIIQQFTTLQATQLPGVINPIIYPIIYSKQTEKWEALALGYFEGVKQAVASFLVGAFQKHCPAYGSTQILNQELDRLLSREFAETAEEARESIKRYCKKQTDPQHFLQSTNPLFHDRLAECRKKRFRQAMTRIMAEMEDEYGEGDEATVPVDDLKEWFEKLYKDSNPEKDENLAFKVHDILQIYYEFSLEHFIVTIREEVVEAFLHHKNGPLMSLKADFIRNLPDATIEAMAKEDETTMSIRRQLDFDIGNLKKALNILDNALQQTR